MVEVPAAGRHQSLYQTQVITRLGEGLAARGRLEETAMARTLETVADFCHQAVSLGAGEILIVATSAVRDAQNGQAFADRVRGAVGVTVQVVPGEEEARLALLGALEGLPDLRGTILLFDIGGGSTEFILARERRLAAAVSLPLGVVPLAERYPSAGPVQWERYRAMEQEIRSRLDSGLSGFASGCRPDHLLGTAGTVTTLAALDQELTAYDPARVHGYVLARARVEQLLRRLAALSVAERAALPYLEPGRADLIVPGTAICLAAMDYFGASSLRVSEFGLREGILVEYLSRTTP